MQETHPIVITSMNAIHVLEGDRVFRQLNITILELAKRVVCRALITLFVDEYGGRHLLRFLRGHDKNHRAKDNGQCHRQQYISIVYHHGAKIHFFRRYLAMFCKGRANASGNCVPPARGAPGLVVAFFAITISWRNSPHSKMFLK